MKDIKFTPNDVGMLKNEGTIPTEYGQLIIQDVMAGSIMMQLARYVEMTAPVKEFDVLLGGLGAYWVGEGERIRTTSPKWTKAKMTAKKLGVILPIDREYLQYKQADFWELMRPRIAEAFYKKFDAATILGVENPFDWSVDKSAADRNIEGELNLANYDAMVSQLSDAGYEHNAVLSKVANNSLMKGLIRDWNGVKTPLYSGNQLDGVPVFNVNRDLTDMKKGTLYVGDFNQAFYGIPYNLNYMISKEATLTTIKDDEGENIGLFEREMAAMRATMDIAFMIIQDEAFASLKAPSVGG